MPSSARMARIARTSAAVPPTVRPGCGEDSPLPRVPPPILTAVCASATTRMLSLLSSTATVPTSSGDRARPRLDGAPRRPRSRRRPGRPPVAAVTTTAGRQGPEHPGEVAGRTTGVASSRARAPALAPASRDGVPTPDDPPSDGGKDGEPEDHRHRQSEERGADGGSNTPVVAKPRLETAAVSAVVREGSRSSRRTA